MKISDIPEQETITSSDIKNGYILGMKNLYPDDDVPVYELQKFPVTAYLSDIDMGTTKQLVQRLRNLRNEIADDQTTLKNMVSNVQTITSAKVEAAKLQKLENTIPYDSVTSQLSEKFATPEEFQTAVNNVYSALFTAVEEMMVQVFTTSMYARQYTPIYDEISVDYNEYSKNPHV